jgi:collagenase-like PrtC family protease
MNQLGGAGATVNVGSEESEQLVVIPELIGDFSLNAANALTALELLDAGLERITASYDLNANGIATLATTMGTSRSQQLEVVAHMKMPIFHTEHCVFARFLSNGNSYLDCGHVCTRYNVHLRDETGSDNLVLADMGCRNTVFAAQAQSGVQSIRQWVDAGVGRIRVELVDEGAEDAETIVGGYLGVLAGTTKPIVVWESLQYMRDGNGRASGVSLGSFRNTEERKAGAL